MKDIIKRLISKTPIGTAVNVVEAVSNVVANRTAAARIAAEIEGQLEQSELAGAIKTRDAEVEGNLKQRNWRPDWMYMLRKLLLYYFGSFITMCNYAFFMGIARGKTWPTNTSALEFYGIWISLGAMLTALTTTSFAIYGIGRTVEKRGNVSVTSVIDNMKELIPGLGSPKNIKQDTQQPHTARVPTVRTSDKAKKRLRDALQQNPARGERQPESGVSVALATDTEVAREGVATSRSSQRYVPVPTGEDVTPPNQNRPSLNPDSVAVPGKRIPVE